MIGKVDPQKALFSTETLYVEKLKLDSFHRFLCEHRHEIFRDEDYEFLYCVDNGRPSVPPSLLAIACVLQTYHKTSDRETVERATYDVRWSVALGTELGERPFAKTTLQEFRAKLILNEQAQMIFKRSLSYARQKGYLKNKKMRVAMDTTHILGKGAVKDTYNLLADGIKKLYQSLKRHGYSGVVGKFKQLFQRYFGKSFKGEVEIDWDDEKARQQLLTSLAQDAKALLQYAEEALKQTDDEKKREAIRRDAALLSSLLLQDLETTDEGDCQIKQGVAQDRILSVSDPEMRHGRKSSQHRFDGHKAAVATDTESNLITAVAVIAGNAHDSEAAVALVEATEKNTGNRVETAIGDSAFGTAAVREQFEDSETKLVAKVPKAPKRSHFTKYDFHIDLE